MVYSSGRPGAPMPSTVGSHHGYMFYQDDAQPVRERSRSRSPPPPYFIEEHMLEGKWLLFYDRATIDEKWMAACELFRTGRLPGIESLKVSCSETFVIVLYADSIEEERIMEAGLNLVNLMKYHRTAFYKTNGQTQASTVPCGPSANGRRQVDPRLAAPPKKNYTYYVRPTWQL